MSFRKHTFPYQVHFSDPICSSLPLPISTTFSPCSSYSQSIPSPPSLPISFQNNTRVVSPSPISSPPLSPSLPSPVALLFLSALLLVLITFPFGCRTLSLHFLLPLPLILISCFLLYIIGVFLPNFCPSESLPLMRRPPFPPVGLRPCRSSSKPLHLIILGISPISLPGNILLAASGFTRPSYVMMVLLNALKPF